MNTQPGERFVIHAKLAALDDAKRKHDRRAVKRLEAELHRIVYDEASKLNELAMKVRGEMRPHTAPRSNVRRLAFTKRHNGRLLLT